MNQPMQDALVAGWQRIIAEAYCQSQSIDTIEVQAKWNADKRLAIYVMDRLEELLAIEGTT